MPFNSKPHEDCPACPGPIDYVETDDQPCWKCGGDTIPPTPGHEEEEIGYFCDRCYVTTHEGGRRG